MGQKLKIPTPQMDLQMKVKSYVFFEFCLFIFRAGTLLLSYIPSLTSPFIKHGNKSVQMPT